MILCQPVDDLRIGLGQQLLQLFNQFSGIVEQLLIVILDVLNVIVQTFNLRFNGFLLCVHLVFGDVPCHFFAKVGNLLTQLELFLFAGGVGADPGKLCFLFSKRFCLIFFLAELFARRQLLVQRRQFFVQRVPLGLCQLDQLVAFLLVAASNHADQLILNVNLPLKHPLIQGFAIEDSVVNQIPQVDFHIPNRVLLFFDLLSQFFQINFVLQKGFGILLVLLLKRFQISSGLLVLLGAFLVFAHNGSLRRHLIFQLRNIAGQRRGVFLHNFLFLAQIQDHTLNFAANFVILLCQLRHFAAMVTSVYRLVHLVQQLLGGLRYAGAAAPAATAAFAATAFARTLFSAAAALQGIAAGIAQYILVGIDARARPYARERIPLRALLWHRDGFHCPLSGGDQRIDGVRRQILHADQPAGQRGKVRD